MNASTHEFRLKTLAFDPDSPIPKQYTGEGRNLSPELEWTEPPTGTREFALLCEDPDAPTPEPWVHWVLYKIPATARKIPAGLPTLASVTTPIHVLQGANSSGTIGYGGPMPPPGHGVHHYHFRLYALSQPVTLPPGASKKQLLAAIRGHVLDAATLTGTYQR